MSETSDKIRESFEAADEIRDYGLKTPDNICRIDNILYGENKKWQVLDVYKPKDKEFEELPVIVSVHGGGWVYGDKDRYQFYCMELAKHGFAVINFSYRLAPEYVFPASMEDFNLVMKWVIEHKDKYGFDMNHLFAVGDSAGAHLLGLYAAACTNKNYAKKFHFVIPDDIIFRALALNCGVYRINMEDELTASIMKDFLSNNITKESLDNIDVTKWMTPDFPPVYLMTCTGDFLKEQAPVMIQKLMGMEIPHTFCYYGESYHKLGHVFHLNIRSVEAQKCNSEECRYFKNMVIDQER